MTPEDWEDASAERRRDLASLIHSELRLEIGLQTCALVIDALDDSTIDGAYDPETDEVLVNELLLHEDEVARMIKVLAHENRHALQEDVITGRRPHPSGESGRREVEIWAEAADAYAVDESGDFFDYVYNPLETDARAFEDAVATAYYKALYDGLRGSR